MSKFKGNLDKIAIAHSYMDGFNGAMSDYRIQSLDKYLKKFKLNIADLTVLEIGAGEGPITKYLVKNFREVDAIEPAKEYFNRLKKNIKADNIFFHNLMMEDFEVKKKYPVIVSFGVLEHVLDLDNYFKVIDNLLEKDGLFIITVPNAESLHRKIGMAMGKIPSLDHLGEQDIKVGHMRYFDTQLLNDTLSKNGMKVIITDGIILKPFPNSKMDELQKDFCQALYEVGKELPRFCAEIFSISKKE